MNITKKNASIFVFLNFFNFELKKKAEIFLHEVKCKRQEFSFFNFQSFSYCETMTK